jgi:hypothetical protein
MPAQTNARPGRNDPCHCGSGRKYKQCCLAKDEAADAKSRAASAAAEPAAAPAGDAAPAAPKPPPKHQTQQPWKATTSRGFIPKARTPRKVGGS